MPTFSQFHSPAQVSLHLALVKDLRIKSQASGLRRKELFGRLDPDTLLLKTAQILLSEDWREYSQALTDSGMMRSGFVYRAHSLVSSSGVGDYIVLPTPVKADSKSTPKKEEFFGNFKRKGRGWEGSGNLCTYIRDGETDGIYPNPELSEVLRTFPPSYTDLNVSVMPSYR